MKKELSLLIEGGLSILVNEAQNNGEATYFTERETHKKRQWLDCVVKKVLSLLIEGELSILVNEAQNNIIIWMYESKRQSRNVKHKPVDQKRTHEARNYASTFENAHFRVDQRKHETNNHQRQSRAQALGKNEFDLHQDSSWFIFDSIVETSYPINNRSHIERWISVESPGNCQASQLNSTVEALHFLFPQQLINVLLIDRLKMKCTDKKFHRQVSSGHRHFLGLCPRLLGASSALPRRRHRLLGTSSALHCLSHRPLLVKTPHVIYLCSR